MSVEEILIYLMVLIGAIVAQIFPWLKKNADLVAEGKPPVRFAMTYIYAYMVAAILLVLSIAVALIAIDIDVWLAEGLVTAIIIAFFYGMAIQRFTDLPFDWYESRKKAQAVAPPS
jgi:uncharacterized Tic20 family protein